MKFSILLLLFLSHIGFSQNILEGRIINSSTTKPVEYANVYNLNSELGTYSKLDGRFNLKYYNRSDKIVISCVGYKNLNINLDSLLQLEKIEVQLIPITIELKPFIVSSELTYTEIGYHKYKHNANLSSKILGIEYATLIKDSGNSEKKIVEIILSKVKKSKGKIRLHLYQVDEKGIPSTDLIPSSLIIETKDYNKQKEIVIDISEFNISLAKDGVFIGIEWIETVGNNEKNLARFNLTKKNETITYKKYNLKEDNWRITTKNNTGINHLNLCVGLKIKD